jgi:hypothetical protein
MSAVNGKEMQGLDYYCVNHSEKSVSATTAQSTALPEHSMKNKLGSNKCCNAENCSDSLPEITS